MENHSISIKTAATRPDADQLLHLVEELARFENLQGPDDAAKNRFYHDGFERNPPRFSALLAFLDDGETACGCALYFDIYSTFLCKPTLYLEDLFVLPDARGYGVGNAMLAELIQMSRKGGYGRIEWACLDWNTKAQEFYSKIGAHHNSEWMAYRMDEQAIKDFVSK